MMKRGDIVTYQAMEAIDSMKLEVRALYQHKYILLSDAEWGSSPPARLLKVDGPDKFISSIGIYRGVPWTSIFLESNQ